WSSRPMRPNRRIRKSFCNSLFAGRSRPVRPHPSTSPARLERHGRRTTGAMDGLPCCSMSLPHRSGLER
ncbi:MAG: hypothetical protein AVDCRST_MAG70-239, partial [uncultured Thermomicrobiales bacterium]